MRRLAAGLLRPLPGARGHAGGSTPASRVRVQADAVVRLLADLESALTNNRPDRIRALAAASLPAGDLQPIEKAFARGPIKARRCANAAGGRSSPASKCSPTCSSAAVRRDASRRGSSRVTSKADAPDRYEIIAFSELASLDGLLQIALDPQKTYSVHNLTLQAPDLTLKMASGTAFVAEESGGMTALVLLGKGDVRFAPPDAGRAGTAPGLFRRARARHRRSTPRSSASTRRSSPSASPSTAWSRRRMRRRAISAARKASSTDLAPRSFNLDLGDLTDEHWSLEPTLRQPRRRIPDEAFRLAHLHAIARRARGHLAVRSRARPQPVALRLARAAGDARPLLQRRRRRAYDVERYTLD